MEHLREQPTPFAQYVAGHVERFTILDVGCSGGIDSAWRDFGDRLAAYGFDAAEAEIAGLAAAETHPNVRYTAGFVVGDHAEAVHHHRNPSARLSYRRSYAVRAGEPYLLPPMVRPRTAPESAVRASTRARDDEAAAMAENQWHQTRLSEAEIYLPAFLDDHSIPDLDFLKIDVDGPDFEILKSLGEVFASRQVLGVGLEVNFFGSEDGDHHTFHNTDRLMRAWGFELFALSTRTYSSAALPAPYRWGVPAQTTIGRPLQGDALYLRDFGWVLPGCDPADYGAEKHAKLAALFAMFNLPDLAAEVLVRSRDLVGRILDVDHALDLLVRQLGSDLSYPDYMAAFAAEEPEFFRAGSK